MYWEILRNLPAKKLTDAILLNPGESRKKWMISIFKEAGELNSRNTTYQFWQQDNQPKEIFSPQFAAQN